MTCVYKRFWTMEPSNVRKTLICIHGVTYKKEGVSVELQACKVEATKSPADERAPKAPLSLMGAAASGAGAGARNGAMLFGIAAGAAAAPTAALAAGA